MTAQDGLVGDGQDGLSVFCIASFFGLGEAGNRGVLKDGWFPASSGLLPCQPHD